MSAEVKEGPEGQMGKVEQPSAFLNGCTVGCGHRKGPLGNRGTSHQEMNYLSGSRKADEKWVTKKNFAESPATLFFLAQTGGGGGKRGPRSEVLEKGRRDKICPGKKKESRRVGKRKRRV